MKYNVGLSGQSVFLFRKYPWLIFTQSAAVHAGCLMTGNVALLIKSTPVASQCPVGYALHLRTLICQGNAQFVREPANKELNLHLRVAFWGARWDSVTLTHEETSGAWNSFWCLTLLVLIWKMWHESSCWSWWGNYSLKSLMSRTLETCWLQLCSSEMLLI